MNQIEHAMETRLSKLKRKLAARDGLAGYKKNCTALRQEIARLEQLPIPDEAETEREFTASLLARRAGSEKAAKTKS